MNDHVESPEQEEISGEPSSVQNGNFHQFISFKVGNEEFAIDIMAVREIKGWTETAPLPNQPDYNLGVLNLRGTIVPTFDLGCRFGMGSTKTTPYHVVIIATVQERTIGLLVDAVSDILTVSDDQIRPVPDMERMTAAEFLSGIITVEESMVVLLSLEKLFNRGDVTSATQIAA
ncbi:MAG: chemotaxis protein CheW [Roseibium sp.]|uniref:chemotaxis protein CheW n=1 Tax=Roseibium sp. TaxID=1936156 RepID=UPI001B23D25C|nr:chemotaxis protein CheW [Roseibium sp.]MBO6508961.1 chemotaxis protein CheW [Roseibium sp.]MBO6892652.1 chemotaxis protein CheW [Roseibium sp.]MBO6928218.1 chemotaxis protein CheW [Roseibium sp.]